MPTGPGSYRGLPKLGRGSKKPKKRGGNYPAKMKSQKTRFGKRPKRY